MLTARLITNIETRHFDTHRDCVFSVIKNNNLNLQHDRIANLQQRQAKLQLRYIIEKGLTFN